MTCIKFWENSSSDPVGFVCVNEQVRFHVGNKYVWMSWHEYTGPIFYTKERGDEVYYEPIDENDPVWTEFSKWLNKQKRK